MSYDAATRTASFGPTAALAPSSTYTIIVKGGTSGPRVTDVTGNPMASTFTSSFTTAAPVSCPCTIWGPAAAVPAIADTGDGNAVELGVKFRADADGFITGLRYLQERREHRHARREPVDGGRRARRVRHLHQRDGERLAGGDVCVAGRRSAPTRGHVASYHTNSGHYSVTGGYFASAGVDTPPLHALASTASANGVFQYGASAFPTGSYNATNYWVDVVFNTTGGADTTAPTVVSKAPRPARPAFPPRRR